MHIYSSSSNLVGELSKTWKSQKIRKIISGKFIRKKLWWNPVVKLDIEMT